MSLMIDFIFKIAHGGGETSVQSHVGIAKEAQPERERKRLGKHLVLKDATADDLAGDSGQDPAVAGGQDVDAANFGFLMQLLGPKLNGFAEPFILGFAQGFLQKQEFEQIGVVEILGVAFEEHQGGQFRLLDVQFLRLRKLEQRTQIISACRIKDDDALAQLELQRSNDTCQSPTAAATATVNANQNHGSRSR